MKINNISNQDIDTLIYLFSAYKNNSSQYFNKNEIKQIKTIFNLEGLQYFKSLIQLDCRNNFITGSVPTLTNTLKRMLFGANSITSFTNIPSSLDTFYCEDNQLTSLPTLPTT